MAINPPLSFSAPIVFTSSSQISDKIKKNRKCEMNEIMKVFAKC